MEKRKLQAQQTGIKSQLSHFLLQADGLRLIKYRPRRMFDRIQCDVSMLSIECGAKYVIHFLKATNVNILKDTINTKRVLHILPLTF